MGRKKGAIRFLTTKQPEGYLEYLKENFIINRDGTIYNKKTGKQVKGSKTYNGYIRATISFNGIEVNSPFHRIIAQIFHPNPFSYAQVNHINGIKTDNSADNLEWCNSKMNIAHAEKMGLRNSRGCNNGMSRLSIDEVKEIRRRVNQGFNKGDLGKMYGIHRATIHKIDKNISHYDHIYFESI